MIARKTCTRFRMNNYPTKGVKMEQIMTHQSNKNTDITNSHKKDNSLDLPLKQPFSRVLTQ